MNLRRKLGTATVALTLGVAPSLAIAANHHGGTPPAAAKSHKCTAHRIAYVASGTIVDWSATVNSDGTYSGTIKVHVTKANHHAKRDKGGDVTYTLDRARVALSDGATPPAAGDRAKVIGKITALAKKCDQTGFSAVVTVRRVRVSAPSA
jgi:hypothetical protein